MAITDGLAAAVRLFQGQQGPPAGMVGFPWDPFGEPRIRGYKTYKAIYDGEHAVALAKHHKVTSEQLHVVVNMARLVVTIPADLMLGEPFSVDYPDDSAPSDKEQKAITDLIKRSELQTNAYEAAVDCGYYGDILYVAERDDTGKARIRSISPDIWFPETDPDNVRDVRVHRLAWERVLLDKVPKKFIRIQEHHKGQIKNRLFSTKDGKIDEEVTQGNNVWKQLYPTPADMPPAEQDTGVDDFLLVHIPNMRAASAYMGRSDYYDLGGLFGAVEERTSHNNKILRNHAEPGMAVSREMWGWLRGPDARAEMGGSVGERLLVDPSILKVQRKGDNGETSEFITWDGKVEDAENFVKRLKEDVFTLAEIDSSLVSSDGMGGIASGRALRLRLVRTLAKVNRKWKYQMAGIEKILTVGAALEGIEIEDMTIEKSDGLPADTMEDIQASTARINAGLSSRLREIMRLDDLDEIEAKALLDEIDAEQKEADERAMEMAVGAKAQAGGRPPIKVEMR